MDDDDADYMQGSDDEVCMRKIPSPLSINPAFIRITASITLMTGKAKLQRAQMSRICTIPLSVRRFLLTVAVFSFPRIAKKEDDPEQALKEFKAIIDKEEEKGDWCISFTHSHPG